MSCAYIEDPAFIFPGIFCKQLAPSIRSEHRPGCGSTDIDTFFPQFQTGAPKVMEPGDLFLRSTVDMDFGNSDGDFVAVSAFFQQNTGSVFFTML